jgi:hypothetical protein
MPSTIALSEGQYNELKGKGKVSPSTVVAYFEARGLSKHAAAGIAGNLQQESNLNAGDPGGGLAQWNPSRYNATGKTAQQQLDQIWTELSTTEIATLHALQKSKTPEDAATVFSNLFERPGIPMLDNRKKYAKEAAAGGGGGEGVIGSTASAIGEAGKAVLSPFESIGEGLGATAKLATLVGEWIAEPLKPLKLIGGGLLIFMGLRTLTRTGVGGSVSQEVRYQAKPVTSIAAAPARVASAPVRRTAKRTANRKVKLKGKANGNTNA